QPSAPSLACLSCHDGVSAINSIVNAPGSGGYTAGGANVAFGTTAAGTAFTMPAGVTQIGDATGNLTNDHPVSITYVEGAASLKPVTTAITGWSGATTIAGLLRAGKVECGSCHDPHLGESDTFLRRNAATVGEASNKGSRVCLTCHDK
ncbi:cytochrome c3 family protein, partial [Hydrogenimonas sp.]